MHAFAFEERMGEHTNEAVAITGRSPIDPATARTLAGATHIWERLLHDPTTGVTVAADSYRVPSGMRRFLQARDQHCRFGTCPNPIHHIHHIAEWTADGGPTDDNNGIGLCWKHHRDVHEGGWTITGNPNGHVTFTSPHGRTLDSNPRRLDPTLKRRLQGIRPDLFDTDT